MRSSVELDVSPPLELERMAGGELVAIRTADGGDEALLRELRSTWPARAGRPGTWAG